MEPTPKTCNAGEVPRSQVYTEVVLALPAPTAEGGGSTNRRRPRRYPRIDVTPPTPTIPIHEVASPAAMMGSGDDGFVGGPSPIGPSAAAAADKFVIGDVHVGTGSPFAAINALGSRQNSVTPYIIHINVGQDISSVAQSLCQQGHLCVLSATGSIAQAMLQQPAPSSGLVTYKGRFEIISLSGLLPESNSQSSEFSGGLNVLLAGPDGRVFGGRLAGILIAASPIQAVVGSFTGDRC